MAVLAATRTIGVSFWTATAWPRNSAKIPSELLRAHGAADTAAKYAEGRQPGL